MRDCNGRVPRSETWYVILGISGTPKGEGFKDVFEVEAKSNIPYSVVVLEVILKIYEIPSILCQLQWSHFFTNKFGIVIKELLAYLSVYSILEYHKVQVVNHIGQK